MMKFEIKSTGAPTIEKPLAAVASYQMPPPALAPINAVKDPFEPFKDEKPLFGLSNQAKSNLPPINFKGGMKPSMLPSLQPTFNNMVTIEDADMGMPDPQSVENEVALGVGIRVPVKKKKKKAAQMMDVQNLPGADSN